MKSVKYEVLQFCHKVDFQVLHLGAADSNFYNRDRNKNRSENQTFLICYFSWLGKWFLFQTFEGLDRVKDKGTEALQIRQLLDEENRIDISD